MKHMEFFNSIKERVAPVYVFHGEEEYIKERALDALKSACGESDLDCSALPNTAPIDELIAQCETLPFIAEKRLIIAKDLKAAASGDLERLIQYLDDFPPHACLVLYFHGKLDKRKKETKTLLKEACEVDFSAMDDDETAIWVQKTARKYDREISRQNAYHLIFTAGRELLSLDNELKKLAAYCEREITKADIETIAIKTLDYNVFKMIDHLLAGRVKAGLAMLGDMLTDGEKAYMILPAVASKLRNMLTAKLLLENGESEAAIKARLGSGYDIVYAIRDCKKKSRTWLSNALLSVGQAEYDIKSGAMPDVTALEYCLLKVFS